MTTSDILQTPQVPIYDAGNLQNDLHVGFGSENCKRLSELRWTDDSRTTKRFPDVVDEPLGAYLAAFAAEDDAYVVAYSSRLVKQRQEMDAERDALWREIKRAVGTFATLSIFPEKRQMALRMLPVMQKYRINPNGGMEAQSVATDQWLEEQMNSSQLVQAARELGIYDNICQLKTLNDEVRRLTQAHNDENSRHALAALKHARTETDLAFRALTLVLNAMALTAADGDDRTVYTELIKSIQETIKYYRLLASQRRRKNAAAREKGRAASKGDGMADEEPPYYK